MDRVVLMTLNYSDIELINAVSSWQKNNILVFRELDYWLVLNNQTDIWGEIELSNNMEFDALDLSIIKQTIWIAMVELTRTIVFNGEDIYLFI